MKKKLVAIVIGSVLGVGVSCVIKKEAPTVDAGTASDAAVASEPPMIKADPQPSPKEVRSVPESKPDAN